MMHRNLMGIALAELIASGIPTMAEAELEAAAEMSASSGFYPGKRLLQDRVLSRLQAKAVKLGVGTTAGLTQEELKAEIHEAELAKLQGTARTLGLGTDGLTAKQLRSAIGQAREQKKIGNLLKRAHKLGISIDGKTKEQLWIDVQAALKAKWPKPSRRSGRAILT